MTTLGKYMKNKLAESEAKIEEKLKSVHTDIDQHLSILSKALEESDHNHFAPTFDESKIWDHEDEHGQRRASVQDVEIGEEDADDVSEMSSVVVDNNAENSGFDL